MFTIPRCNQPNYYGELMLTRVSLALTPAIMLLFSFVPNATTQSTPEFDLLIKNGTIIDGSGRAGFPR